MIPTKTPSHPDAAEALLTERFRDKPVIGGFVRAITGPFDSLEQAVFDTLEGRALGAPGCSGVWLDSLGAIAGEPRNGRADEAYLVAIKVRVRVNRSKGRAIDIIEVAKLLDPTATYTEDYPLAWTVAIYGTPHGGDYIRLLTQAKANTSYGVLETSTCPEEEVAKFADAGNPSPDDTLFGSAI